MKKLQETEIIDTQRVKTDPLATTRPRNQTPRSEALYERGHFPF
jgi:hypothetical protein